MVKEMFEIRDEYGTKFPYNPKSYDMACRVAYQLREMLNGVSVGVVSSKTKRYTSEVFYNDPRKDSYARNVAKRLLSI